MAVLVFGATGGTGRAVVHAALAQGSEVKAFVRDPAAMPTQARLSVLCGDVMEAGSVTSVIDADDLVVVSLGNSQSSVRRMLGAMRTTPRDVCEVGTRNIIQAMSAAGARRLVVVSAFGIGSTRDKASWLLKFFYRLLLKEQMADKERQEALVKASGLDWTIVQPVALTNAPPTNSWLASTSGEIGLQKISRDDLAFFLLECLHGSGFVKATVALSGVRSA